MGRGKLISGLQQESASLKKMAPPKTREGVTTAFLLSLSTQPMLDLKNKIINTQDENNYVKLIQEYERIKISFMKAAQGIIEGNFSESKQNEFAQLTQQYYSALTIFTDCQLYIAQKHPNRLMKAEGQEFAHLQADIDSYKKKVEEVAFAIADHQLRNIQKGEMVRLHEVIPHIKAVYDKVYEDAHNPFWRWIKNIFKKSDRAKEVEFLNQISKHPQCSESIRLQAIRLVHDKIMHEEMFGKEGKIYKGSKLGKLLGGVLEKGDFFAEKGDATLADFIKENKLNDAIPDGLKDYLVKTDLEYGKSAVNH